MHCSPTHQLSRLAHGQGDESLVQFSLKPQIPNVKNHLYIKLSIN